MAIKFGERAVKRKNHIILMIAFTEKQAYNLFFKTLMYLMAVHPKAVDMSKKRGPTKHEINLKNGSKIMCYACGRDGSGLRTYTVNSLVIDEAAPMAREVLISVLPMLSVTKGSCDMSSTPKGKTGFFYECSLDSNYKKFYVSYEDCPRHDAEFLKKQRKIMTEMEFSQEYKALFLDELRQLYPDNLIKSVMTLKRPKDFNPQEKELYLGTDVARLGSDDSVFAIFNKVNDDNILQIENMITSRTLTSETTKIVIELQKKYNFKQIFIDAFGVGTGVFDTLLITEETKRVVVALNHYSRTLTRDEKKKTKVTKEDIFFNLQMLMEQKRIQLLDDDDIFLSLKSIQYEYLEDGKCHIFGSFMHIADAVSRGSWCGHERSIGTWIA